MIFEPAIGYPRLLICLLEKKEYSINLFEYGEKYKNLLLALLFFLDYIVYTVKNNWVVKAHGTAYVNIKSALTCSMFPYSKPLYWHLCDIIIFSVCFGDKICNF